MNIKVAVYTVTYLPKKNHSWFSNLLANLSRRPSFSKISPETSCRMEAKFYVEPQWKVGLIIYINGPGHKTKMAVVHVYGKKIPKTYMYELD